MIDISLVICTRNRATQLGPCLDYIKALAKPSGWELVVVDNGSIDTTKAVIESFAATVPFPVVYVFEPVQGLSSARNAGVARASGALITFTDDDCYAQADWLDAVQAAFADPAVGFISGRVLLHDPTDYPTTISLSTTSVVFAPQSYIPPGVIKGANMAFRKTVLDQIGNFDPLFGSGSLFPSEDCDAAARASLAGWVGRYVPESAVSHHHGRKAADVGKLFKSYDIGRGAYHMKLLITCRAYPQALKGWRGLIKRMLLRPQSLRWELDGALGYWKAVR